MDNLNYKHYGGFTETELKHLKYKLMNFGEKLNEQEANERIKELVDWAKKSHQEEMKRKKEIKRTSNSKENFKEEFEKLIGKRNGNRNN